MTHPERNEAPADARAPGGAGAAPHPAAAQIVPVEASITGSLGAPATPPGSVEDARNAGEVRDPHVRFLSIGDRQLELRLLDPRMDAAYDRLYDQALSGRVIQWNDFGNAVVDFLRTAPSPIAMDRFFESATPRWKLLAADGRYDDADGFWARVVGAVTDAERTVGATVHKGSGYYFWACNALQREDVDRGLLLMHEARVEDARTHNVPPGAWPRTSATKVVSLDADRWGTHPASSWVANQAAAINVALEAFGSKLRTTDIRQRLFLAPDMDPARIYLFVHAHAALLRLERTPPEHRDNDFVGRLALGHLFHLAVVIEGAIKKRSARQGKNDLFMAQAEELSAKLGGKLKDPVPYGGCSHAWDINRQQREDCDVTLRNLLAGVATYGGSQVLPVDRPLCIAYVLRNLGGHQSAAPSVVSEKLGDLRVQMLGVLAGCVEAYYP